MSGADFTSILRRLTDVIGPLPYVQVNHDPQRDTIVGLQESYQRSANALSSLNQPFCKPDSSFDETAYEKAEHILAQALSEWFERLKVADARLQLSVIKGYLTLMDGQLDQLQQRRRSLSDAQEASQEALDRLAAIRERDAEVSPRSQFKVPDSIAIDRDEKKAPIILPECDELPLDERNLLDKIWALLLRFFRYLKSLFGSDEQENVLSQEDEEEVELEPPVEYTVPISEGCRKAVDFRPDDDYDSDRDHDREPRFYSFANQYWNLVGRSASSTSTSATKQESTVPTQGMRVQ